MASNYFDFSPLSGSGNGNVRVWPKTSAGTNTSHSDRVSTLTVSNGSVTRTVTIRQFGIPTITLNSGQSTNVPATGTTLSYTIYSRYPFGFVNQPEWISISDSNGRYYYDGSTYPANYTTGTTFYITVGSYSRTDVDRQTSDYGFAFRFKAPASSTSWDSHTTPINIVQAHKEEEQTYLNVTPVSASFDWNTTGLHSVTITVDASSSSWTFTNTANGYFDAVKSGNTIVVSTKNNNTDVARRTGSINIALGSLTASVSLSQYRQPRIGYNSGSDLIPVAMAGGTRYVTVTSDYNWWFLPLPIEDYITITDGRQNVMKLNELDPHLPIQTNNVFNFKWGRNETEAVRRDYFYLGWIGLDGQTYLNSRNTVEFSQLDTAEVVHSVSCPDALTVSSIGGINRVMVISEDDWWFINVPSWITVYDEDGNQITVNDAAGLVEGSDVEHTYYLHWDAFTGTGSRSYRPTIEYAGGTQSAVVTYTQYDYIVKPYLRITTGYELPYYRNIVEIHIKCDYDWYWSSIPSYVRIVDENNMPAHYSATSPNTTSKGQGVQTFYWIFDENTGSRRSIKPVAVYGNYSGRTFTQVGTAEEFTLYQMGPYEISPTSGSNAMPYVSQESFTFSLATTPWSYTAPSWMTVTADTESHFGTFHFSTAYNDGINRQGVIRITSGSHSLVYTYSQGGAVALGPEPNAFVLDADDTDNQNVIVRMLASWTASTNDSWITIVSQDGIAEQGSLVFKVSANTASGAATRNGTITVTDGNDTYPIDIEQSASVAVEDYINTNYSNISQASTAATYTLRVQSNKNWSVSTKPSWITVNPTSGNGDELWSDVSVVFSANTGSSRSGVLVLTAGNATKTIGISQAAGNTNVFTISPQSIDVSAASSTQTLSSTITATGGYTATANDSWIHIVDGSSASDDTPKTLYFYCDNYTETDSNRAGTITITRADNTKRSITVTQYKDWFFVSGTTSATYTFKSDGTRQDSTAFPQYQSNYPFVLKDISGNYVSWIDGENGASSSASTMNISVSSNSTGSMREVTVYVYLYNYQTSDYDKRWGYHYTIRQYSA